MKAFSKIQSRMTPRESQEARANSIKKHELLINEGSNRGAQSALWRHLIQENANSKTERHTGGQSDARCHADSAEAHTFKRVRDDKPAFYLEAQECIVFSKITSRYLIQSKMWTKVPAEKTMRRSGGMY